MHRPEPSSFHNLVITNILMDSNHHPSMSLTTINDSWAWSYYLRFSSWLACLSHSASKSSSILHGFPTEYALQPLMKSIRKRTLISYRFIFLFTSKLLTQQFRHKVQCQTQYTNHYFGTCAHFSISSLHLCNSLAVLAILLIVDSSLMNLPSLLTADYFLVDADVTHTVRAGWIKWRQVSGGPSW